MMCVFVKKKKKIKFLVCSWFLVILISNGNLIKVIVIRSSLIRTMPFTTCIIPFAVIKTKPNSWVWKTCCRP